MLDNKCIVIVTAVLRYASPIECTVLHACCLPTTIRHLSSFITDQAGIRHDKEGMPWPLLIAAGEAAVCRRVGGAFGGKVSRCLPIACSAAIAASKLHRPVRYVLNRNDDFQLNAGQPLLPSAQSQCAAHDMKTYSSQLVTGPLLQLLYKGKMIAYCSGSYSAVLCCAVLCCAVLCSTGSASRQLQQKAPCSSPCVLSADSCSLTGPCLQAAMSRLLTTMWALMTMAT